MHSIDYCAHTNRWTHQHPGQKLILAGGMLLLALLLPPLAAGPFIFAGMVGLALLGARIPPGIYLRFLVAGMLFALAGAIPLVVSLHWESAAPAFAFSAPGGRIAGRVLVRAWAALSCLLLVALTTPLASLVGELRRLKVPGAVIELMQLVYRMLWLLDEVSHKMRLAQTARLGYGGLRPSIRSSRLLAGGLLVRTLDRARRLETGLAARGYQGSLNVQLDDRPISRRSIVLILASQGLLAAVSLIMAEVLPWLK